MNQTMNQNTVKTLIFGAISAIAFFVGTNALTHCAQSDDADVFFDRQWIDSIPQEPTDLMEILVVSKRHKKGAEATISQWRQHVDLFQWQGASGNPNHNVINIFFPQEGKNSTLEFKAFECDHEVFELCAEVSDGHTTKKFYSFWDWRVENINSIKSHIHSQECNH